MAAALAASMGGMGAGLPPGLGAALAAGGLSGLPLPGNGGVLEKTADNEDSKSDCSENLLVAVNNWCMDMIQDIFVVIFINVAE